MGKAERSTEEKELRQQMGRVQRILLLIYVLSSFAICFLTVVCTVCIVLGVDGTLQNVLKDLSTIRGKDILMLLGIIALYGLPYLFLCALIELQKAQRSLILRRLPEEDRRLFGRMSRMEVAVMRQRSLFDERVSIGRRQRGYTVEIGEVVPLAQYFLYRDKWTPLFWRMAAYEDVVWLYEGHSMFQYTDMEKCIVTPRFHFYTIVFYTRDGKKRRILTTQAGRYEYRSILERCRDVIQGYGTQQKELAKQRFLMWEGMDGTIGRNKSERRSFYGKTAAVILLALAACFFGYRQYTVYIESDAYRYRQCMKEAKREMAEGSGHYMSAYRQYEEARSYDPESAEAKEGSYQALLLLARENASLIDFYPGGYSGTCYEMLLSGYDVSPELYKEAASAYLKSEHYMEAFSVLRRGFQDAGYEELEAVYESVAEHLKVVSRVTYENGYAAERLLFDEAGNETERIHYKKDGEVVSRTKRSYDRAGNCVREDYYFADERLPGDTVINEYDESGRLLQTGMYDGKGTLYRRESYTYGACGQETSQRIVTFSESGTEFETFASQTEYNAAGSRISYAEKTDGEIVWEVVYEYDGKERLTHEERRRYGELETRLEYVWQETENGGSLCESFDYDDTGGEPSRITTTRYDAAGQKTQETISDLEEDKTYEYAYSYNENGNVIWKKTPEEEVWYTYDERQNVTWMKTGRFSENGGSSERTYTYDELGNLTEYLYTNTERGKQTQEKTQYVYTYVYTGKALDRAE